MDDKATGSVRREWLYEAARASQEVLCEVRASALDTHQVLKSLMRLPEAATPLERLIFQGLVLDVLLGCVGDPSQSRAECTRSLVRGVLETALRPAPLLDSPAHRAADLIRKNYAYPLNAIRVARAVGCNQSRLRRLFKDEIGISMRGFHTHARVAQALALFAAGPTKTTAIARCVGYRSDKDLYRALRDVTGCRPAALRLMSSESIYIMARQSVVGFDQ